jgi:hypothetical protein
MLLAPSYPCPQILDKLNECSISKVSIASLRVAEVVFPTWATPRNRSTTCPFLSTYRKQRANFWYTSLAASIAK